MRYGATNLMVRNLLNAQGDWDCAELSKNFLPYEIEAIKRVHLTGLNKEDKRYWICCVLNERVTDLRCGLGCLATQTMRIKYLMDQKFLSVYG